MCALIAALLELVSQKNPERHIKEFLHSYTCFDLQDWALGVLHAKIIAAITLMGPQWWLKTVIEQVGFT